MLILRRKGYEKPFAETLMAELRKADIEVEEMRIDKIWEPIIARLNKDPKPDVLLRWEEHGCLFSTRAWVKIVEMCYRHNIAPLSIDLGYFAHYKALMIDQYLPDGTSAIRQDWPKMPEVPDWSKASPLVTEYRARVLKQYEQAGQDGPPAGIEPGYVLMFLQFSATLARPPFRAHDMTEWAKTMSARFQAAGDRVVIKASPVGPFPEIPGVPLFRSKKWGTVDPVQNARLLRWAKHSIICCSSVSNEMAILNLPVVATGRSWFTGLGVFTEPDGMEDLTKLPTVNMAMRGKWVNWWLARQFEQAQAGDFLRGALSRFYEDPYPYDALYTELYQIRPTYGRRAERHDLVLKHIRATNGISSILDVGCGSGHLVRELLELGYDARGVDVASIKRPKLPEARFQVGNILSLPYPNGYCDAVVCMDTLEHLRPQDLQKGLAELKRVARSRIVLSLGACPSRTPPPEGWPALHLSYHGFDEWKAILTRAGLRIVAEEFRSSVENCLVCEVAPVRSNNKKADRTAKFRGSIAGLRFRPCCGTVVTFKCEHPAINREVEGSFCARCSYVKECTGYEIQMPTRKRPQAQAVRITAKGKRVNSKI